MEIKLWVRRYARVQIDEEWSYVGKKERMVRLIYAYCPDSGEILAFALGKRSAQSVQNLMLRLKNMEIYFLLTDDREVFKAVLPYERHLIGKQFTKAIEGVNNWFLTRLRRLIRRTVCFSKKTEIPLLYDKNPHLP